jgi:hypothetical protein
MFKKLKSLLLTDEWFYGALVLLVGVFSFALGRSSVQSGAAVWPQTTLEVPRTTSLTTLPKELTSPTPIPTAPVVTSEAAVVASKSGTKYHLQTCPGAKQIKDENKLYFATIVEAEAAGYKRAANCP